MELDSVVVGHVTVDVNVFPHGIVENILGGAPTYSGFALTSLGEEVGIVSKIGEDFPDYFPPLFSKFGLNTEGIFITSGGTTKFENKYTEEGERRQVCREVSGSITLEDIPQPYLNSESFYVSPVMKEISPKTISKISEGEGLVMLDPQGIFRKLNDSGEIGLEKPDDLDDYLSNVDIIKIGKDELQVFDEPREEVLDNLLSMGPNVAILTLGEKGCEVLADGEVTGVDGIDVKAEDLTGAGDVFGAAFLYKYRLSDDPVKSARFANAAAGLKIEYKGPTGFPSREEVEEAL